MNRRTKGAGVVLLVLLTLVILNLALFLPGLPWSARCRHALKKIVVKAEIVLSRWRGHEPRLVSISGDIGVQGARILVLDSRSGWATFSDQAGKFTIPDLLWYPETAFDFVISTDEITGKLIRVSAPSSFPSSGVIDAGRIMLDDRPEVVLSELPGDTTYNHERFDFKNRDYYIKVFEDLTSDKTSDEEKIKAVNDCIAERLNYNETQMDLVSPRRVIETGSQYCGHLSTAMGTVLAVSYPVRMIHLMDENIRTNTHAVVEVFYGGDWHLYDPTFGVSFKSADGDVLSYRELKLNPALVTPAVFSAYQKKYPKAPVDFLTGIYNSGHHHYYYLSFNCSQFAHAWWVYKDGVRYVPSGGRILLVAAGVRPGTNVTYHIRKPGSDNDVFSFTSRRKANSNCVLDEEDSPPIELAPGIYEVYVDIEDGNVRDPDFDGPRLISNRRLGVKLEVRD